MGMILITKHAYQIGLRLGLENEWSFTGALILLRGGAGRGARWGSGGRAGLVCQDAVGIWRKDGVGSGGTEVGICGDGGIYGVFFRNFIETES